ncbi:gluconokinase [Baaleninema simplex]|uniref:gluconokinase n=1 Tax=Baaleninema simplex TaxID=2862350 RepID=UPI000368E835|nr:gluconokinase [Baaleninema simplex]
MSDRTRIYIVMGVSGAGKTSVGRQLARRLNVEFIEGDEFHPPENVDKMRNGVPLTDRDRDPWLWALRDKIDDVRQQGNSAVVACSALKAKYREILEPGEATVTWIFLDPERSLLQQRLAQRQGHFMTARLLESQFEALEKPQTAIVENARGAIAEIVESILQKL